MSGKERFRISNKTGINLIHSQIHAQNLKSPAERDLLSSMAERNKGAIFPLAFGKRVLFVG